MYNSAFRKLLDSACNRRILQMEKAACITAARRFYYQHSNDVNNTIFSRIIALLSECFCMQTDVSFLYRVI